MNKEQLFLEIDEIYSEWHGGDLYIGKERENRIKQVIEKAINYTRCCEQLPCKNDVASLVIEEIEKNTNTILEQIKQINKFTVNKKTLENLQKLNRNR